VNKNKLICILAIIFLFVIAVSKFDFEKERRIPASLGEFLSLFEFCDSYGGTGQGLCWGHIAMMKSFLDNLTNGNKEEVVAQIEFPLTLHGQEDQYIVLDNPDDLVDKYYHYVFPKHIIKDLQISFQNDDDMFWNYQGMTFGRGSLWFNKESGKVIAINHTDKSLIAKLINRNKDSGSVYRAEPSNDIKVEGKQSNDLKIEGKQSNELKQLIKSLDLLKQFKASEKERAAQK
jgi:hypothetical protein